MKVYVLVLKDRHIDDEVSVHETEDSAFDRMEKFVTELGFKFHRKRYWSGGEGYSADIHFCEVRS